MKNRNYLAAGLAGLILATGSCRTGNEEKGLKRETQERVIILGARDAELKYGERNHGPGLIPDITEGPYKGCAYSVIKFDGFFGEIQKINIVSYDPLTTLSAFVRDGEMEIVGGSDLKTHPIEIKNLLETWNAGKQWDYLRR
jgi:hypothetical protein